VSFGKLRGFAVCESFGRLRTMKPRAPGGTPAAVNLPGQRALLPVWLYFALAQSLIPALLDAAINFGLHVAIYNNDVSAGVGAAVGVLCGRSLWCAVWSAPRGLRAADVAALTAAVDGCMCLRKRHPLLPTNTPIHNTSQKPINLFPFPNTLAGDLAVTLIVQVGKW
jgi:hypothetical protein